MAQIEKTVMLRLRNNETRVADPNDPSSHASYQTTLKTPVTLEEGDQVRIHTCILDTSAEGIIQIDDPAGVECSIGVLKYIRFYQPFLSGQAGVTAAQTVKPVITLAPITPSDPPEGGNAIPDVKKYFACVQKGAVDNAYYVTQILIDSLHQGLDGCGNCNLTFGYTSGITGLTDTFTVNVPKFHPISHMEGIKIAVNVLVQGNKGWDDFTPNDSAEFYADHKLVFPSNAQDAKQGEVTITYSGQVNAGTKVAAPFIETMEFNIPTGRYTPGEISTIINDKLTNLEYSGPSINEPSLEPTVANPTQTPSFCVNNPFLSTLRQMTRKALLSYPGHPGELVFYPEVDPATDASGNIIENVKKVMTIDVSTYEANHQASQGYGTPPDNRDDIFIGAEQIDLNFDPVLKKLNFSIMHFPIYVGYEAAGTPGVPGVQYNTDGKLATTYSGAAICSLDPPEFWQKQLGFVNIVTPYQLQTTGFKLGDDGLSGETVYPVKIATTLGKNVTGIFRGLDIPVPKTDRFFAPEATKGGAIETATTTGIIADRQFDVSERDEGYYMIEVGFKFPQMMIGGQYGDNLTNNNIQSVVGKYYVGDNNFLQDTGAGSIAYEHHGEPELLTDLNVRILLPDGSIPSATELGPKNSIFLEIIKTETLEPPAPIKK